MAPSTTWFREGADRGLKVANLINSNSKQWNGALVHSTFTPSTREDILKIKLGNLSSGDKLVWNENKAKVFSVRTAYQMALRLHHPSIGKHSSANLDHSMWKRIWAMNVPPKVRIFVWKAYSNILPTKANLFWKKVQVDPIYTIYG